MEYEKVTDKTQALAQNSNTGIHVLKNTKRHRLSQARNKTLWYKHKIVTRRI